MIVYHLACKNEHTFDTWFRGSAACDEQLAEGKVVCPECGTRDVRKAMMAPRLNKRREGAAGAAEKVSTRGDAASEKSAVAAGEMMKALRELRRRVEQNADYVGGRFAEEARKIHYGEVERRDIYGEASAEEATDLKEEGVEFFGIPWAPRHDS